ncbi:hypothetical protein [Pseudomonas sp. R37(2017)]|uniref:hypothetical protein n=1 Tax=Pseudomonas sp. R37(2017) TaxID=1981685 RepID=UPI000A1DD11D|nr:hypothetical protein [Pseudomonas sp. R37(2017)]
MWKPSNPGVFLRRIDSPESDKVIIKLVRENTVDVANRQYDDRFSAITTMTLHINNETRQHSLDFDPWSDINVIRDGSIDEKDINAINQLALAFYHQSVIDPDLLVYISRGPVDDVDVFDPTKPVEPLPPLIHTLRIEALYMYEEEELELRAYYYGKSFDEGNSFAVRGGYSTGFGNDVIPDLENLAKAFYILKL